MSTVFVIGDTHFGHANIVGFTTRGKFATCAAEHDELLIENWNAAVRPRDVVYVVGDVAWTRTAAAACLPQLHGMKYLVGGNHDVWEWVRHDFDKFFGAREMKVAGKKLILTHIPVHPQELYVPVRRWDFNIHGHLHDNVVLTADGQPDPNYICVCCEHTGMRPVALEDVVAQRVLLTTV